MATQIQRRRGTTAQHSTFTGALGELTVDTDKKTVVVHDGSTAGGFPLAPLASPALTGTPTAPTAAAGTNTAQLATTEFVQGEKPAVATQAEMNAGTESGVRSMSPLGVAQAIAAKSSGGIRGQVFTSSGTFTVPAGVTSVKVRGCGGGGGSGASAGAGGTTSFGTYCSATGGSGPATPGTGSGGEINLTGGVGGVPHTPLRSTGGAVGGGQGGVSSADTYPAAPTGLLGGSGVVPPTGYGNGAGDNRTGYPGAAAGGYFEKYITGLTPGSPIVVTIGHRGAAGSSGAAGAPGICIVEW